MPNSTEQQPIARGVTRRDVLRAGAAAFARFPALAALAPPLAAWRRQRELPAPAARSFHERWAARAPGGGDDAT